MFKGTPIKSSSCDKNLGAGDQHKFLSLVQTTSITISIQNCGEEDDIFILISVHY